MDISLHLTKKEVKVLRACLNEGSRLMLKLFLSPHSDNNIRKMAKHDSLVIAMIRNKINENKTF